MVSFRQYFLLEVKASKANIALFKKKYADSHYAYKAQMHQAEGEAGSTEDEFIEFMIDRFNEQVKRGTMKQKDIFGFEHFASFMDELDNAEKMVTGSELKRIEKEGATRVFENDKAIIVHPRTHEASCHYGAGSTWCVAGRDPEHFRDYTAKGVVLLYILPKEGTFDIPHNYKVKETEVNDANVDYLIFHYPEAFEWSYDSVTKNIGKYISAAYAQHRKPEPLSTIAGWSPDNAIGIAQTREYMKRVIKNWNLNGSNIVMDVLGQYWNPAAEDIQSDEDYLLYMAVDEGLTGFLTTAWGDITPGSPGAEEPDPDIWKPVMKIMQLLHQGGQAIGRDHPIKDEGRKNDKFALAVHSMEYEEGGWLDAEEQAAAMEEQTGLSHAFGDFSAEAFNAENSTIGVNQIVKAAGLANEDIKKISEYISKFAGEKVWEDKVPKKVYEYMEQPANQTPENIKKADEFFSSRPFWQSSWEYAWRIRGKLSRTAQDDYVDALDDDRKKHMVAVKSKPWVELEEAFIDQLDKAAKQGNKARDYMLKKLEWSGVQEMEKEFNMDAGGVVDHVNAMYDEWKRDQQQPIANYLGMASGLLGYLFHVKKYNWPELEERILDPKYYHIRVHMLGPSWIQFGRGGKRWEEFEDMLKEKWMYTSAHPFQNQKQVDLATEPANRGLSGPPRWEREQAKTNIHNHNNLYGDVENIISLVKQTKQAYGGGTGGSERAAWEEAKDAWWNSPDIVKLYWGHNGIVKKQKPSEKTRGKEATKYFVTNDRIPRPFYHEVKPGAWLPGIPNIFTLSTAHTDMQYVGQYDKSVGDVDMSVGNLIDRHEGSRRGA